MQKSFKELKGCKRRMVFFTESMAARPLAIPLTIDIGALLVLPSITATRPSVAIIPSSHFSSLTFPC